MKTKKNELRFSTVDLGAPWAPYFMSLDIKKSLSESRAELRLRLWKWFSKHPSEKCFFFFKIPELVFRTAAAPIAAENRR